jgi:flagella basal body P-ring formation protein FlgA
MISCVELLIAGVLAAPVSTPIEARVRDGLAARWGVEATRLELAWGAGASDLSEPGTVTIEGAGREGWVVLAIERPGRPTQVARVRAGVRRTEPVAARDLAAGASLTAADIAWQDRTQWGAPRLERATPGAVATGWRVRRPLAAGERLAWPAVAPPLAVQAGAPVTLVWREGGVEVSRPGIAVNGAVEGGWVQVRVDGRAGRLVGRATGAGEVSLAGGMR